MGSKFTANWLFGLLCDGYISNIPVEFRMG